MPKPSEYRAIAMWGRQLGSYQYYIDNEQAKAARENAPIDALYERDGKWVCVSDLQEGHEFRASYNDMLRKGK